MLIAVASKDGININQHFGHAERFLIYDISEDTIRFVEERGVEKYCSIDTEHPLRGGILKKTADLLSGCSAVVTAQIGEYPESELLKLGIESYTFEGDIESVLNSLKKVIC